jgi:hypothetical protein
MTSLRGCIWGSRASILISNTGWAAIDFATIALCSPYSDRMPDADVWVRMFARRADQPQTSSGRRRVGVRQDGLGLLLHVVLEGRRNLGVPSRKYACRQ